MLTKYILGTLSIVFLVLACVRLTHRDARHPQARTWLLIGVLFGAVSAYLFLQA